MSEIAKQAVKEIMVANKNYGIEDVYSKMKEMFGKMVQELLEAEMSVHVGYDKNDRTNKEEENSRNGHRKKTVSSKYGEIELGIPRDEENEFTPQIVKHYVRDITGIEEQVWALYARGMTTRDISAQINDLYGCEMSAEMVSKMTDKILPQLKEWQSRPLESVYTFVFMDAIHFKIRHEGQIKSSAAYIVMGVNTDGIKDILGIWIGEVESSKFWLSVMTDLKNRGLQDILIFSVDGLTGISESIKAAYPNAILQRCVVHQIRNSLKYVPHKDKKELAGDLKNIYNAPNEEAGLHELKKVKDKWDKKYPNCIQSWENNWDALCPFFKYPKEIRRIMYTTNIIEGLNRQFRKVTKNRSIFPHDQSLEKMLYLSSLEIMKKWTMRYKEWDVILNYLSILFPGRL